MISQTWIVIFLNLQSSHIVIEFSLSKASIANFFWSLEFKYYICIYSVEHYPSLFGFFNSIIYICFYIFLGWVTKISAPTSTASRFVTSARTCGRMIMGNRRDVASFMAPGRKRPTQEDAETSQVNDQNPIIEIRKQIICVHAIVCVFMV